MIRWKDVLLLLQDRSMAVSLSAYGRRPDGVVRSRRIAPGRWRCSSLAAVTPDLLQGKHQSCASHRRVQRSDESVPTTPDKS